MNRILVVDDEESVRYSFKRFLNAPQYQVEASNNGQSALENFNNQVYDLIILDIRLPDMSGIDVLKKMKEINPRQIVLIMTAFGSTEATIDAIKFGAYDFILKPFDIPSMKRIIDEALANARLMKTQVLLHENEKESTKGDRIIGDDPAMQDVYKTIGRIAMKDVNILIRVESGTGKELIARAIYQYSNRADKPFIAFNCAAVPETLLESELFGFEKGAFTGANRRKPGKFEQADNGTLFLDEIGDMTLSSQVKLLRVIQEGTFERLGGESTNKVDVRIIAASNQNLEELMAAGKFREDLFYRIKIVTVTLPPLRDRKSDIVALAQYFMNKHAGNFNRLNISLSNEALIELQNYNWPGNIRELENIISRSIVLSQSNIISAQLIKEEFNLSEKNNNNKDDSRSFKITPDLIAKYNGSLYEKAISEIERELLVMVLSETNGNQVKAAKILGISRVMLSDRIEKYKIKTKAIIAK